MSCKILISRTRNIATFALIILLFSLATPFCFNQVHADTQDSYTVTVIQTQNGNISPDTSSYSTNSSPTFTITPDSGYYIDSITIDGNPVVVEYLRCMQLTFYNIDSDHNITATYAQHLFTLTIITVGEGTVSPGNITCVEDTYFMLQAVNANGWSFSGWSGDITATANATIMMDGNKVVTATFTQNSEETPTPTPEPTAAPTSTPAPIATATQTPQVTTTSGPGPTSTPKPTSTPTIIPTPTAKPTSVTTPTVFGASIGPYLAIMVAVIVLIGIIFGVFIQRRNRRVQKLNQA